MGRYCGDLMAVITFTPFGRGGAAAVTHLTTPYTTLRTLSSGIGSSCFAPDAKIPEYWASWNLHNHKDGSLATDCIRHSQFHPTAAVLYSWTPKTLILFGTVHFIHAAVSSYKVTARFDSTSWASQSFPSGTVPKVFLSARENPAETSEADFQLILIDVTSQDFTFLVSWFSTAPSYSAYVDYLALGVAPGYLVRPEG